MSGLFDNIKDAKYAENVYFLPGTYRVEVQACKSGTTRKKADYFLIECKILQSSNPDRPVGSKATHFITLKPDTAALAEVKRFVAVATDTPEEEVDAAGVEMLVSDEQPLRGKVLGVSAVAVKTRSGGDYTRLQWETVA